MSNHDEHDSIVREERAIYAIIVAASAPVVIGLIIGRTAIDVGATLSLLLAGRGIAGLLGCPVAAARSRATRRLPRATIWRASPSSRSPDRPASHGDR